MDIRSRHSLHNNIPITSSLPRKLPSGRLQSLHKSLDISKGLLMLDAVTRYCLPKFSIEFPNEGDLNQFKIPAIRRPRNKANETPNLFATQDFAFLTIWSPINKQTPLKKEPTRREIKKPVFKSIYRSQHMIGAKRIKWRSNKIR